MIDLLFGCDALGFRVFELFGVFDTTWLVLYFTLLTFCLLFSGFCVTLLFCCGLWFVFVLV